jgi:putative phosphoribosyl transferase
MQFFRSRSEAGQALAEHVKAVADRYAIVLALPRGGVPVAFEVARELRAILDVFLVRKLGMPGQEELALGAIASGGMRVLNRELIDYLQIPESVVEQVSERERAELERREQLYREGRPMVAVKGQTVILVDDGLATGASMMAATRALRQQSPARMVIAVPVAARQTCEELGREVDEIICLATPRNLGAVGMWYHDFSQITDEDVRRLLEQAAHDKMVRSAGA